MLIALGRHGLESAMNVSGREAGIGETPGIAHRLQHARQQHAEYEQHRQHRVEQRQVLRCVGIDDVREDRAASQDERQRRHLLREQSDGQRNLRPSELRDVQRFDQQLGGGEPRGGILLDAAVDRVGERRRRVGAQRDQARQLLRDLLRENLSRRRAGHRRKSGEREMGRQSERIEIASPIDIVAARLLGAHVLRRADDFTDAREPFLMRIDRGCRDHARDAEVHDQRASSRALDHHVVRLDVAVDDAASVRVRERVAHVLEQSHRVANRQRTRALHPFAEALAFDIAHDVREEVGRFLHGIHGHDVRMGEARRHARFAKEAFAERWKHGVLRRKHLEGDEPVEAKVAREIHGAHSAVAQLPFDRIPVAKAGVKLFEYAHRADNTVRPRDPSGDARAHVVAVALIATTTMLRARDCRSFAQPSDATIVANTTTVGTSQRSWLT